jgi:phosphatidate cytidylyltransferase
LYLLPGILYFAIPLCLLTILREGDNGLYLTVTLMLVVWASDTVAYMFGRTIGGPKLAPKISPNKTWAGMAGSVVGAGLMFYGMIRFAPNLAAYIDNTIVMTEGFVFFLIAGAVLGVVGQAGDLLESHMKRKAGVKDSGRLIPGHGGVLDRIDALLLVIPGFVLFCFYGL